MRYAACGMIRLGLMRLTTPRPPEQLVLKDAVDVLSEASALVAAAAAFRSSPRQDAAVRRSPSPALAVPSSARAQRHAG